MRFGRLNKRAEVVTLALVVLAVLLYGGIRTDRGLPAGVFALGAVGGALIAMHAVGLVLVYRANRVINLAQLQLASLGGLVFVRLVQSRLLLVGVAKVCAPCLPAPETIGELRHSGAAAGVALAEAGLTQAPDSMRISDVAQAGGTALDRATVAAAAADGPLVQAAYWASMVIAVALTVALVWIVYTAFIKRFTSAPRLILTVATLGAGEFVLGLGRWVLDVLPDGVTTADTGAVQPPLSWQVNLRPATLSSADLLIVLAAAATVVGLTWFLRSSSAGVVLRASADNPQRAATLGVNLTGVTARAWMIAGGIGGLASVLAAAQQGSSSAEGYGFLSRALAAAVVGGFAGLPLTVLGGIALGVADRIVLWSTGSTGAVSLVVLLMASALLLVQRSRASRAEMEAESTWEPTTEIRPTPAELRKVGQVRRARAAVILAVSALVLGFPWYMSPGQTTLAMGTVFTAIIGLSLLVLTGWAGQISLGQVGLGACGAWVTGRLGWPFVPSVIVATLAGALAAAAVGVPALRLRGLQLAIVTLAFSIAVSAVLLDPRLLGRAASGVVERPLMLGIDFDDDRAFYYLMLLATAGVVGAVVGMRRSRIGRALIASRDNELAAQAFGIALIRLRITAFAASGAIAGLAGSLLVFAQRGLEPQSFQPQASVTAFLVAVIGGLGAVSGPIFGAVVFGLLGMATSTPFGALVELLQAGGLLVVAVLLFMPGGVASLVFGTRDAWLRRVASRLRIEVPSLTATAGGEAGAKPMIAPRVRPGGGEVFVPLRYRLAGQWAVRRSEAVVDG